MGLASRIHSALTGLHVSSVSIGNKSDKTTWRLDWDGSETQQDKDKAANIIALFEIDEVADIKLQLHDAIDQKSELIRLKYITPGDGMSMTYREKFEQAELVNEIGETAANALSSEERIAAYPTLAASVGLEAATLWECAQLVRSKYAQFAQLSYVIEKTRLSGKAAVSAATTVAEAQAAYEAITWTV